jgi:pimeloyl-ACP methyl ester carboxylesterase
LFLGFPIVLGQAGDPLLLQRYLERLTDGYSVVVMEYPPAGGGVAASRFTPDRACSDILSIADVMGVERFAWYGYSWGGLVGLQLAART